MAEPQTGVVTTGGRLGLFGARQNSPGLVEDSGAAWCIVLSLVKSALCWEGRLPSVQPFPEAPIHNTVGVPRDSSANWWLPELLPPSQGLLRICAQIESHTLFW